MKSNNKLALWQSNVCVSVWCPWITRSCRRSNNYCDFILFYFIFFYYCDFKIAMRIKDFPGGSAGKESTCNAGDLGLFLGLGRSPGEGNDYPLQYSGQENSMDYGPWCCRVRHNWVTFTFNESKRYFHICSYYVWYKNIHGSYWWQKS